MSSVILLDKKINSHHSYLFRTGCGRFSFFFPMMNCQRSRQRDDGRVVHGLWLKSFFYLKKIAIVKKRGTLPFAKIQNPEKCPFRMSDENLIGLSIYFLWSADFLCRPKHFKKFPHLNLTFTWSNLTRRILQNWGLWKLRQIEKFY